MRQLLARHPRESAVAAAWLALLLLVGALAPGFLAWDNARDLLVANSLYLLPAIGMTAVLLARQIDISIGSQFAVVGLACGLLSKAGAPSWTLLLLAPLLGGLLGWLNGALVAGLQIPSIIVTLGTMVAWRAAIKWVTQGAWVRDLPPDFLWFGMGQAAGQALLVGLTAVVFGVAVWAAARLAAGRAVYAVGCDAEAARLVGLSPSRVTAGTFVLLGALTGLAALLHSVRFEAVQPTAGLGLELRVVAAVVVGGTAVMGGRGTLVGTLLGVLLLGTIGTQLTFLHVNPAWERALQGLVILGAVALEAARREGGDE
ncbi:MAG: ABC transporter permease [Fimbriimonadaceae bacterium]|nr:ABC transporter permease [Fimbriimonadaceae bacterium]